MVAVVLYLSIGCSWAALCSNAAEAMACDSVRHYVRLMLLSVAFWPVGMVAFFLALARALWRMGS